VSIPDLNQLLQSIADNIAERISGQLGERGGGAIAPRLLSVEQAAIYIGRTKDSVQHMAATGKLPVVRSDRRVFLDREDLDRWIDDNKQGLSGI
jgi:excisionase family DNA binding protein